jgi:hypothetical protein
MNASSLMAERRLTLNEAANRSGVNPSTAWRWALSGARGTKLESYCLGQKRYTTVEALERFSAACTAASASGQSAPSSTAQVDRETEAAMRELSEMGV